MSIFCTCVLDEHLNLLFIVTAHSVRRAPAHLLEIKYSIGRMLYGYVQQSQYHSIVLTWVEILFPVISLIGHCRSFTSLLFITNKAHGACSSSNLCSVTRSSNSMLDCLPF